MQKKEDKLVWAGYLALIIYNIFSVPGIFKAPISESFMNFYNDNFGVLILLEFIVVAALFVNMILNFDKFKSNNNKIHLVLTALVLILFFLKIVFFFMRNFEQV